VPAKACLTTTEFGMGQFMDDIGEDFLGLHELGIAAKLGLSSLSIPKCLLKCKRNAKGSNATAKSTRPPPPYPPPQPFVPRTSETAKNHYIWLLRGYFEYRFTGLVSLPDNPQILLKRSLAHLDRWSGREAQPSQLQEEEGVVSGVMQPAAPVLSSAGLLNPLGVSAAPSAPAWWQRQSLLESRNRRHKHRRKRKPQLDWALVRQEVRGLVGVVRAKSIDDRQKACHLPPWRVREPESPRSESGRIIFWL
jgi:hypothetical protein